MRLVAPFGFYGSGNIGDEATLLGFGRLIERFGGGIGVDVASSDPAHTKRVEPGFRYYQYIDGIMGLPAKLHARCMPGLSASKASSWLDMSFGFRFYLK